MSDQLGIDLLLDPDPPAPISETTAPVRVSPIMAEAVGGMLLGCVARGRWESQAKIPKKVREIAAAQAEIALDQMRAALATAGVLD